MYQKFAKNAFVKNDLLKLNTEIKQYDVEICCAFLNATVHL